MCIVLMEITPVTTGSSSTTTTTKTFVLYLFSASSLAVLSVFLLLRNPQDSSSSSSSSHVKLGNGLLSNTVQVWPELEVNWRSAVATLIGFVGSACGTVGGVGGGGIFVPMLNLIVGFDTKSAAALSKCMIMGASMSSVWYNVRVSHPTKDVPIIDYDLALLFQPMLMLGITIGVSLSVVFPFWLITVLIIILFLSTSSRSFFRGILMWKQETLTKMELERKEQEVAERDMDDVIIDAEYEPLLPRQEKSGLEILCSNINWKGVTVLMITWSCFLFLQIIKNDSTTCSPMYWVVNVLQFPVAITVFGWEAVKLYRESKKRRICGNCDNVCEASIEWSAAQLCFCALCGILGGTVGGLLGSGGGFILGPLLLEIGVIPQVASATATFVMMFSSSLSVVEFYFLKRFPIPYALYLMGVSVLAGFWGQYVVRKIVAILKRASLIVFILSSVIFASAVIMGVVGIKTSIHMIKQHEYMGFLSFCES